MATYRELLDKTKNEIREADAREAQAVPGAVHVPRGFLESRIEQVAPSRETPVVVYCAGGARSAFAAKSLNDLGYANVVSLTGGFTDWKRNGGEIVVPRVLTPEQRTRYSRHTLIPEIGVDGQLKLLDAR